MTRCLLLLALAACGDPLYAPDRLQRGETDGPETPGWELRWFAGPGEGFDSPCRLVPIAGSEVFEESLAFGWLDVLPPTNLDPARVIEGSGFRYALAVAILVDQEGDALLARRSSADAPTEGVWGAAGFQVMLWAEGDLDALAESLDLGRPEDLVRGEQWVDVATDFAFEGDFDGLLTASYADFDLALPVDPLDLVPAPVSDVVIGRATGGVRFESCE